MPQLRSHFLYPLAEKGAGQIGDVLIAVKTKQPQCLDFIVRQAEGIATGFVGVVLEELLHIRERLEPQSLLMKDRGVHGLCRQVGVVSGV